jgi:predicted permease
MSGLINDLRHALRLFRKRLGFTAIAVLTIGVGVAATTTIFSAIEGTLLRPWPFPGSERLMMVVATWPARGVISGSVNYADYEDWRQAGIFERVTVFGVGARDLADGSGEPERINTIIHSEDFFATLGVAPTLGRLPLADEYGPGAPAVAVLTYGMWQGRFGGDRDIIGRTVRFDGEPATIVGVMSPEADVLPAPVFITLRPSAATLVGLRDRDNFGLFGMARLRPGQTLEEARAQLVAIQARIERDYPQLRAGSSADLVPLAERVVGSATRTILWVMMGAVAFVLLIGCVNLANLQLAGATRRGRELAIRSAIGAARGRLVRQLLAESMLLALAGGALGVSLSLVGIDLLVALAPSVVPRMDQVGLNMPVLTFALAVSISSALIFGLLPALRATRQGPSLALADASFGSTSGPKGRRFLNGLIAAELALAVVLLAGAGLMLRTVASLRDVDPGFDVEDMITFKLTLPAARYERGRSVAEAYARLKESLEAVPGVEAVAVTSSLPLGGGGFTLFRAHLPEGRPEPPDGEEVSGIWDVVHPGYFAAMGLPLIAGRDLNSADNEGSIPVMIVNREFARRMFGSVDEAVGKRVRSWRDENIYREIVGVAENVRYFGAGDETRGVVYVPHRQISWLRGAAIAVRTRDASGTSGAIRAAVRQFDPDVALASFTTMSQILEDSIAERRFAAKLLTAFAALALLLAALGIYGVLSYAVAQRNREFGVRMALGATAADVRGMVLRESGLSVLVGAGLGLAGAFAITRVMSGLLFGVSATDPTTLGGVIVVLALAALAASWVPAVRATRVDPMQAMRPE